MNNGLLGKWGRKTGLGLATVVLLSFLYSGNDSLTQLEQAERRGNITLLTRNGASTYFIGPDGATGPEYEIVSAFADYLDLRLDVRVADNYGDLGEMLKKRQGDLVAANLTRTTERERHYSFGPDYAETRTVVIYKRGRKRPRQLDDLIGLRISVIADSSYALMLEKLQADLPKLRWKPVKDLGIEGLLMAIAEEEIDATLVDSNIFNFNSQFYPVLKVGFELEGKQPQAWAFVKSNDDSLLQKSRSFFRLSRENGLLAAIQEQYQGENNNLDRVGMFQFMKQVRERLPPLIPIFQEVAEAHDMDWRLLAAIGYQESHWDPEATSSTGVRGIMMLTKRTARQLGIRDRLDPMQSVEGGARYFKRLRKRLPQRIPEPDLSWMALAAYNIGLGHLEDARVLTQKQGGNPDRWLDVSERLPLLGQEKYYRQTRYGYARGYGAQKYVNNIRSYFDTLVWMETRAHPMLITQL